MVALRYFPDVYDLNASLLLEPIQLELLQLARNALHLVVKVARYRFKFLDLHMVVFFLPFLCFLIDLLPELNKIVCVNWGQGIRRHGSRNLPRTARLEFHGVSMLSLVEAPESDDLLGGDTSAKH